MPGPDAERGASLLQGMWREVVAGTITADDSEVDGHIKESVATLIESNTVALRYCLPTQLLGKLTDSSLDTLCLQRGEGSESQWDPRSFATKVIVPWVRDNENVLGTSSDPYVSNPLRQPRVMPNPPNVRSNSLPLWEALYAVLNAVEERNDPEFTRAVFLVVLLEAHKALERQDFDYPVLPRVSLEQTLYAVKTLLACSREGEHAMSLAAACSPSSGDVSASGMSCRGKHPRPRMPLSTPWATWSAARTTSSYMQSRSRNGLSTWRTYVRSRTSSTRAK